MINRYLYIRQNDFKSQVGHLMAAQLWAKYLAFLGFSFCVKYKSHPAHSDVMQINEMNKVRSTVLDLYRIVHRWCAVLQVVLIVTTATFMFDLTL